LAKTGTGYRRESIYRLIHKKTFYLSLIVAIFIVMFVGSWVVYMFEKGTNPEIKKYGDSIWLSVQTMTTVGYGDVVPVTVGGRIAVTACMVLGIALVTTAITASATARIDRAKNRSKGLEKTTSFREHFVICGWNSRGKHVVARLISSHGEKRKIPIALLCDLDDAPYEDDMVFFYSGSPISEDNLKRVNVNEAKSIIILADEATGGCAGDVDARTVLCALTIMSMNPKARITAEVFEPENVAHLRRAGVGEILDNNMVAGNLLAQSAIRYGLIELITSLSMKESGSKVYRVPAPDDLIGRKYSEAVAELETRDGYTVLVLRRDDKFDAGDPDIPLKSGDVLLVLSGRRPPTAME
jgi:voltage-gated potassium channel